MFLDCYIESDSEGFPSATYRAESRDAAIKAKAILGEWFDRVEVVEQSNGQSPGEIPDNVRRIMAES